MKLRDLVAIRAALIKAGLVIGATIVWSAATGAAPPGTDISNIPLVTQTAAAVKPNIMLLLDASSSMGRTHMPDEVETITKPGSIGYKSSQCNVQYYDPAKTYLLPKKYDGSSMDPPPFNNAPYAGYGAFYQVPDTSTTDLRSQFVAWDINTLETIPTTLETAGAAYYYVYTGPETVTYKAAPCTQADTRATVVTPGGGLWTRVDVSTQSSSQQTNFANWYSYYRTRLALVKSAASLSFAPLNDSKRVGFITVQPKDTPTSSSINSSRYLQLGAFDPPQKQAWYSTLFSQKAGGASPAREGLARVGRYYGGKTDGINTGMNGPDPVGFSCQQNFTIMTTDGYWNAQTETPGGGGVKLDGTTLVGQEDGDPDCHIGDPYCSHPFFDGVGASIRVTTDEVNNYTPAACLAGAFLKSTDHITTSTQQILKDTTTVQKRTLQYTESQQQKTAQTTRTTKTVTQLTKTTTQYAKSKTHMHVEKYKVKKSQDQTTMVRAQFQQQTIQNFAQTSQMQQVTTTYHQHVEQWDTAISQSQETTTQSLKRTYQYKFGATQKLRHTYRILELVGSDEHHVPVPGACPATATCVVEEDFPPAATHSGAPYGPGPDPTGTCTASTGVDPTWERTDCSDGPLTVAYGVVASCPATGNSGSPNYVYYQCDQVAVAPTPVFTAFNGTCLDGSTSMDSSQVWTECSRPPANNTAAFVPSCPTEPTPTGPNWIIKTCTQPPGPNNQPPAPSPPCNEAGPPSVGVNYVTSTCTKVVNTTFDSATCSPADGMTAPYNKITCTPQELSRVSVPAASCTGPSTSGTNSITCESQPVAPYPTSVAVQTCAAGPTGTPGDSAYYETTCTNGGSNNHTDFVQQASCSTTPATASPWISTVCSEPVNDTQFIDPVNCHADPGTSWPYLHTTCNTVTTLPADFVDPTTCPLGDTVGTDFVITHCTKSPISSADVLPGACPTDPDPWVVVICGPVFSDEPVGFCVPGSTGTDGVDNWVCVQPSGANNAITHPSSCSAQDGPTSPPDYVNIACSGPTITSGPTDVAPASCVAGPSGTVDNVSTTACVTNPDGPYPAATGVASCTPGLDGGGIFTVCANPAATNFATKPVQTCTVTPPTGTVDSNQVTTICTLNDTGFVYAPTCATAAAAAPLWQGVTCSAPVTYETAKPTDVCTVGTHAASSPFQTIIACNPTVPTAPVDTATCVTSNGTSPDYVHNICGYRSMTTGVATDTCANGTDGSGVRTTCTPTSGSGTKYTVATTTTVTTQHLSGGAPAGPPSVASSTGATSAVNGGQCYVTPQTFPPAPPVDTIAFPTCSAWPCSIDTAVADGSTNSLADVAQYYYKTDLRPSMPDNVPKAGLGVEDDNAPHQHMTTFVVGLGVSGTLNYQQDYRSPTTTSDFAKIRTGEVSWPLWPDPSVDYTNSDNWNNAKAIDDYWHTAVNGRGTFFSATDPTSVVNGLGKALADVEGVVGSGAADGVSTLEPQPGDNFVFSTSYKSGPWWGDLQGSVIDLTSGAIVTPAQWSARALLDNKVHDSCDERNIHLMRGTSWVDFTWMTQKCVGGVNVGLPDPGTLTLAEQAAFGSANYQTLSQYNFMTADQQLAVTSDKLLNFVRGQRAFEGYVSGDPSKLFRTRVSVLGDIVGSQPVYVKTPFASYADTNYASFKLTAASRTAMVYVGANDGMLHAFKGTVDALDAQGGQEQWAAIPSAVLGNLFKLADDDYKRQAHQFYVDGTPVAGDISVGGTWKTILVGGLNAGGKGYYAIDVTDPANPAPLWEFNQLNTACSGAAGATADCNLGFTFGKPVITKLMVGGVDTWVVMFTSGYNNLNNVANDGEGFLYVVNANTGALIYKIGTGQGGLTNPSGLAQINNYVDNVAVNNETLRAYGGDLLGNIWRFDFGASPSAQLIGTAMDSATPSQPQPITTRPELAELNGKPMVFVGTGEFLGQSDINPLLLTSSQRQSIYGIVDPLTSGPIYSDLRGSLRHMPLVQTGTGPGSTRASGACDAHCTSTAGWLVDFPFVPPSGSPVSEKGERVSVDMKLVLGTLIVGSNVPNPEECSVGGHSWFNYFDFRTGSSVSGAPRTDPSDPSTATSGQYLSDSLLVGFNVLTLPPAPGSTNRRFVVDFHFGDTSHINLPPPIADPTVQGNRISWREITK